MTKVAVPKANLPNIQGVKVEKPESLSAFLGALVRSLDSRDTSLEARLLRIEAALRAGGLM